MRTTSPPTARQARLKITLEHQRDRLLETIQARVRESRLEGSLEGGEVFDEAEHAEARFQRDIEFGLLQVQGEALAQTEAALERLADDRYGICCECGTEIPVRRLMALPFATRCLRCETATESGASLRGTAASTGQRTMRELN